MLRIEAILRFPVLVQSKNGRRLWRGTQQQMEDTWHMEGGRGREMGWRVLLHYNWVRSPWERRRGGLQQALSWKEEKKTCHSSKLFVILYKESYIPHLNKMLFFPPNYHYNLKSYTAHFCYWMKGKLCPYLGHESFLLGAGHWWGGTSSRDILCVFLLCTHSRILVPVVARRLQQI